MSPLIFDSHQIMAPFKILSHSHFRELIHSKVIPNSKWYFVWITVVEIKVKVSLIFQFIRLLAVLVE